MTTTKIKSADRLTALKAQAYDLIAAKEQTQAQYSAIQQALDEVNKEISDLLRS